MTHEPIKITAHLSGGISLPGGPLAIDALLVWAEAQLQGLPPLGWADAEQVPIEVAKS